MLKKKSLAFAAGAFILLSIVTGGYFILAKPSGQKVQGVTVTPTFTPFKQTARLEIFTEPVTVKLPGKKDFVHAEENMIIPEGTYIKTGKTGRAQLVFSGGTVTRIDYDSVIHLKEYKTEPQNIFIEILEGRVWSRIKKLFGNESYRTSGGTMIATVRGTSYGHGVLPGDYNRGTVIEGTVELTCVNGKNTLTLEQNMKVDANCVLDTGFDPLQITQSDMSDEWIQFNVEEDNKLNERFGSQTYGENILGESISITPSPTLRPGQPSSTPKPQTNSSTGNPTNTPKPGNTSIPLATSTSTPPTVTPFPTNTPLPPTPFPPVIKDANADAVSDLINLGILQSVVIIVTGENLDGASISMSDATYIGVREQNATMIRAVFHNVKCGGHTITVSKNGSSAEKGLDITPVVCLNLGNILR